VNSTQTRFLEKFDDATGRTYWVNSSTNETTYAKPDCDAEIVVADAAARETKKQEEPEPGNDQDTISI
jgi:hypothetical protein